MSFVQKDDKFVQVMAELANMAFGRTDDVFLTMRFSHLHGEEEFSNTVGFGGWMSLLDTGIAQVRHQTEVLQKLKDLAEKVRKEVQGKMRDNPELTREDLEKSEDPDLLKLPRVPDYNPEEVEYLLTKFKQYNLSLPPDDPTNIIVIRNHLWMYNRNLMAGLRFRYIHLALLNGRYATDSRTLKAFIELSQGLNYRPKEIETENGKGFHIPNPFAKDKEK